MDIEGVTDFITLAECRSFSKSAQLRFVTQPAFSRRIKSLEESIGASLVDRSVTPISLTKAGERFLIYAVNMVDLMNKAIDEMESQKTILPDPVYIVMPLSLSVSFFSSWYSSMHRSIPDLNISLTNKSVSKSIEDLRKGLVDFAIVLESSKVKTCYTFDELLYHPIGKDTLQAVIAPHAKGNIGKLIAYNSGSYMDSCAQEVFKINKKQKVTTVFESSSSELLRSMALTGFGMSVLQESMIEDDLREGFLVPAFKNMKALECNILLVRTKAKLPEKAESLWQKAKKS